MPQIVQVAAIALATLGTGAATMSVMNGDIPDLQVPQGAWSANGALDGALAGTDGHRTQRRHQEARITAHSRILRAG